MRFRIWMESMESADEIFKRLSGAILSCSNYQEAVKKLEKMGFRLAGVDWNSFNQLGHDWKEVIYRFISSDNGLDKNPNLSAELDKITSSIESMGFPYIQDSTGNWHYFHIPGSKGEDSNKKIHVFLQSSNLIIKIFELVKQNLENFRQIKYARNGSSFESRRDNFVMFLSKRGEENIEEIRKKVEELGLKTDVGEDFKGKNGTRISATELLSLRLSAILLSLPGIPLKSGKYSVLWKETEQEFLESDPIGSKYLKPQSPASTQSTQIGGYKPSNLVLSGTLKSHSFGISTTIGRRILPLFVKEDDVKYFSEPQFDVKKTQDGWYLVPHNDTHNQTTINGRIITTPTRINTRDRIGVTGKLGKQVTPITVSAV